MPNDSVRPAWTQVRAQTVGLVLGPVLAVAMLALPPPEGLSPEGWRTAAVAVLMAVWWATEALPLAATALLPIALFPLLSFAPIADATAPYANPLIYLVLGGFFLARAIERWGLHRRIALAIVHRIGSTPGALLIGFMVATASMSAWISNTATTIMMLPIAVAVVRVVMPEEGAEGHGFFAQSLLLSVAYAASIGGLATLIGTPTNALVAAFAAQTFGLDIGLARWMLVGVPVSLAMLAAAWGVFALRLRGFVLDRDAAAATLRTAYEALDPMSTAERRVAMIFAVTAVAWITRPFIVDLFALPLLTDAGIAMCSAIVLFLLPSGDVSRARVLDWATARGVPFDILILFGGGLSLAAAIADTGLAAWLGGTLGALDALPLLGLIAASVALVIFLTELTSNAATTAAFLPIIAALAVEFGVPPMLLAVPAGLAASCAFMLPVATPPNAIVFGSGLVTIGQMVRMGFLLNLIGIAIVTTLGFALAPLLGGVGN